MRKTFYIILTLIVCGTIHAQTDSLKLIKLEKRLNQIEKEYLMIFSKDSLKEIKIDSQIVSLSKRLEILSKNESNKVIESYRLTNERVNNQLTFVGIIATIFGVIIALGTIFIGFESIKSDREKKNTLKTLDEAKKFVSDKKVEFDDLLKDKYNDFDTEYTKLLKLAREQLIDNIDSETERLKIIASKKSKEIEDISVNKQSDEVIETITKKMEFFESVGIPDDPEVLLSKAKLLSEKKMHVEAIKLAEKLVEIEPDNSAGYWRLGWDYSELEEHEKAITNYQKVIELDEEDSSAHNNLGVRYEAIEQYYDSLKEFDRAIELSPNKSLYHRNRARILFILKSEEEAIASYIKATRLSPQEEYIYEAAIKKLKELKRYDEVVEFYDSAIKNISEKSFAFNFDKAGFYSSIKKYDEAREIYQLLIDSNYKTEDCKIKLALISFHEKDYDTAINNIEEAISLNPKKETLHVLKIEILFKKDIELAKAYSKEIMNEIKNEGFYFQIARQFSKDSIVDFAKEIYSAAIPIIENELQKEEPVDFANYIECLISIEEYGKANDFYNTKLEILKNTNYKYLIEFLLIIKDIITTKKSLSEFDLTDLKEYYSTESNYSSWNFEDILQMIENRVQDSEYKKIKEFSDFMKGQKTKDYIDKIV
ncbi:tetratricopeptide repeat protein [uncultured Tenacibaculum sp.]|uniref:tetratricopeptide repeat protein n=1 Tax=uncultured Tenacibaculum sp. TaxID=174713 RepID=UPI0026338349|nr:tetratricopeptide repeat protein [uncultured Tenacibaculum sp.]